MLIHYQHTNAALEVAWGAGISEYIITKNWIGERNGSKKSINLVYCEMSKQLTENEPSYLHIKDQEQQKIEELQQQTKLKEEWSLSEYRGKYQELTIQGLQWKKGKKSPYLAGLTSDTDKEQMAQMVTSVNIPPVMCCQTMENNPESKQTDDTNSLDLRHGWGKAVSFILILVINYIYLAHFAV